MGGRKNKFRAREATGGDGRRRRERNIRLTGNARGVETRDRKLKEAKTVQAAAQHTYLVP